MYKIGMHTHGLFKKYKTFSVLIYSYINPSGIAWKNKKWFSLNFEFFPISTRVGITVYLYGKNVLYFIYNIAQKSTKFL